jgi:hypothetical protein
MADKPQRADLERIWAEVRSALAEYRLDDLKKHLDIPEGMPVPNRGQAKQFAEALPDLARARFLKIASEGDLSGYYAQTGKSGTEVTVIRFGRRGSEWRLLPAPHTMSSYSTDETVDPAKLIESEPSLKLAPGDGSSSPEPAPTADPRDARPEAEIRKELESIWKRIRAAFAAGHPEAAAADLLYVDGASPPSPDEAKAASKERLPDLIRGQFLKLGWRADKPQLAGYYAETKVGDFKKSTVSLIVFVRHEGRWKFAPGPAALSTVEVPKSGRPALLKLIDTDPRLAL